MADGATNIGSLEITISSESSTAVKHVDALYSSLAKLQKAMNGFSGDKIGKAFKIQGVKSITKDLEAIGKATSSIQITAGEKLTRLSAGLKALSSVGDVKIKKSLINNIVDLNAAVELIDDHISEKFTKFSEAMGKLAAVGNVRISQKLPDTLLDIGAAMDLITDDDISRLDAMTSALQKLSGVDLHGFPAAFRAVSKTGKTGTTQTEEPDIDGSEGKDVDTGTVPKKPRWWTRGIGESSDVDEATRKVNLLRQALAGLGKAFDSVLSVGAKGFGKALKGIGRYFTDSLIGPIKRTMSAIDKWKGKLLNVAFYRAVRSAIKLVTDGFKEGYENFKAFSDAAGNEFSASLKSISSNALYLKNSLGALAAPLVNSIAPAIDYLIDKFVALINVINMLMSLLSGRGTYFRAVRGAGAATISMGNAMDKVKVASVSAAKSMNDVGIATMSANNSMRGIALASIETKNAMDGIALASVNANDGIAVASNTASEVKDGLSEVGQAATSSGELGKNLSGAADSAKEIRRYLIGIDELNVIPDQGSGGGGGGGGAGGVDVGGMFEEVPLPDWAQGIKDAIDAGKWYEAGELLADKVNELIDKIDGEAWGRKLGEKIQNGIEFALGFLRNVNWEDLGGEAAGFLNGLVDTVDPEDLGALLAQKIRIAIELAYGFVNEFHWDEFGDWLGGVVNGWADEIDEEKLANTISTAIKGALSTVSNFFSTADFSEIGYKIGNFIATLDWNGIFKSAFTAVGNIGTALINAISGFLVGLKADVSLDVSDLSFTKGNLTTEGVLQALVTALGGIGGAILFGNKHTLLGATIGVALGGKLASFYFNNDGKLSLEEIARSLSAVLAAVGGAALAFKYTHSVKGALIGATIGVALSSKLTSMLFNNDGKLSIGEIASSLATVLGGIGGAALVFKYTHSAKAALLGATVGVALTMGLKEALFSDKDSSGNLSVDEILGGIVGILGGITGAAIGWFVSGGSGVGAAIGAKIGIDLTLFLKSLAWDNNPGVERAEKEKLNPFYKYNGIEPSGAGSGSGIGSLNLVTESLQGLQQTTRETETVVNETVPNIVNGFNRFFDPLGGKPTTVDQLKENIETNAPVITQKTGQLTTDVTTALDPLYGDLDQDTIVSQVAQLLTDTGMSVEDFSKLVAEMSGNVANSTTGVENDFSSMSDTVTGENATIDADTYERWQKIQNSVEIVLIAMKSAVETTMKDIDLLTYSYGDIIESTVKTTTDSIQKNVNTSMNTIKTKVTSTNSAIKSNVTSSWNSIKNTVTTALNTMNTSVQSATNTMKSNLSNAWTNINSNASSGWSKISGTITGAASSIASSVSGSLGGLASRAYNWGADICTNMANGINQYSSRVKTAASNLAQSVKDRIGFSEPKLGPLSDFHTYMPDMLKMMAQGIRDNAGIAVAAATDLAQSISDAFSEAEYAMSFDDFDFDGEVEYSMTGDSSDYSGSGYDEYVDVSIDDSSIRESNEEVINALYAMGQRIIEAINNKDTSIIMDGNRVGSGVTRVQNRQNRASGRSLSNAYGGA